MPFFDFTRNFGKNETRFGKTLNQEMERSQRPRDVGDVGDDAFNDNEKELNSQLMAFESRELVQIERAIEMIRIGSLRRLRIMSEEDSDQRD